MEEGSATASAPPSAGTLGMGLSAAEVQARLHTFGRNEIPETHVPAWKQIGRQLWGPIPWMIEVAAVLAAILGHWSDFAIIVTLLAVNGGVGFWEEHQAGNAVAALRRRLALRARVLRDGRWASVDAAELVPGDIARLRLGDIVPADIKLGEGGPLQIDQSSLTGESLPVSRGVGDLAYSGAVVQRGEAVGVVQATGQKTFFGRAAHLVDTAQTVSHLQKAVVSVGDYLIAIAIALAIILEVVAWIRGENLLDSLQFVLVLTVAGIPVALPAVLSVTMAVGSRKLAHEEALVTRLTAIEELAGVDVLCADKTGTLTQNRLTVGELYLRPGVEREALFLAAALASRREDGDPIDLAILESAPPVGPGWHVAKFVPFDPSTKLTEAEGTGPDGTPFRVCKGAPQVIIARASLTPQDRAVAEACVQNFAGRGFRSLGVARAPVGGSWQLLGILPLYDPPRPDSAALLKQIHESGISTKMVTGDQLAIARETARALQMGPALLPRERLRTEAGTVDDAGIEAADGFAQVLPEDKFTVVDSLQRMGHVVAMTGDGVNDAPALRKADAGIAVVGATDAARAAASIVLVGEGLKTILSAVEESRRIFRRMMSYATYRISETIRILLFIALAVLVYAVYPITALMIVLLAILNDGAILSIAYDRAPVSPAPETWNIRRVMSLAAILGIWGVGETFLLFYLAWVRFQLPFDEIQTLIYLKLSVSGHLLIFITRTDRWGLRSRPANILLVAVLATQGIGTVIALTGGGLLTPLPWYWVAGVWGYCGAMWLGADAVKVLALKQLDGQAHRRPRWPSSEAFHRLVFFRRHGWVSSGVVARGVPPAVHVKLDRGDA